MIIPNDNKTFASESDMASQHGGAQSTFSEDQPEPPAYSPSNAPTTQSESDPTAVRVNYVYASERYKASKGSWTIDPNLRVPSSMLPKIPDGEERQNFYVHSVNGSVEATLRLISDQPTRSTLGGISEYGSVVVKIVSAIYDTSIQCCVPWTDTGYFISSGLKAESTISSQSPLRERQRHGLHPLRFRRTRHVLDPQRLDHVLTAHQETSRPLRGCRRNQQGVHRVCRRIWLRGS